MEAIDFDDANAVYAENQPEYLSLPAHSEKGVVTTCWKLSDEEKAIVASTGIVFIQQNTFNRPLQPINALVQFETNQRFLLRSGKGYLAMAEGEPIMTTEPSLAAQMTHRQLRFMLKRMRAMGFHVDVERV